MIRRQHTNNPLEDGMPDLQAGNEPRSTSEPNTPTLAICTPTSSTPRDSTAEFGSDELGNSNLENMAMESWMFPLSQAPIQAPPQLASPPSTDSAGGGYQAAERTPSAANTPQWRVVGMQELSTSPHGHHSPLVAEPPPVCPSPSTAFSHQDQGTRTKNVQVGLYQPAATSPAATSAAQWRVIDMHEHQKSPLS